MSLMPFVERLAEGPVVADGAMGTYLHELGYDTWAPNRTQTGRWAA